MVVLIDYTTSSAARNSTALLARRSPLLVSRLSNDGINLGSRYLPDLVKGDLDSIRDDVQRYYASYVGRTNCSVPYFFFTFDPGCPNY